MSKILSAEMFKLRREKVTGVVVLINIALVSLFSLGMVLAIRFFGEEIMSAFQDPEMVAMGMDSMESMFADSTIAAPGTAFALFYQFVAICAAVLAGFFICVEFDTGTIRNTLSVGKGRMGYYISKLITLFVTSIILAVISIVIYMAIFIMFFGFSWPGGSYAIDLLLLFGANILIHLTYVSLFAAAAFMFRSFGVTLGVALGFTMFIDQLVVMLLGMGFFEPVRFIQNIFPYHNVLQFVNVFSAGYEGEMRTYLIAAAACVITIIGSTVVGMVTFAKRDVK